MKDNAKTICIKCIHHLIIRGSHKCSKNALQNPVDGTPIEDTLESCYGKNTGDCKDYQIYNNVRLKEFKNKHQIPNKK